MTVMTTVACQRDVNPWHALLFAGLTNALWLQPGSVIVQLIPYGWERSPGKVIGYEQLSKNVNCTHLMWRNMEAENAFFEPTYFEEHPDAYQMHPNELDVLAGAQYNELGQLHPHYLYQVRLQRLHFMLNCVWGCCNAEQVFWYVVNVASCKLGHD